MKTNWFPTKSKKGQKGSNWKTHTFPGVLRLALPKMISLSKPSIPVSHKHLWWWFADSLPYAGCLENVQSLSREVLTLSILQAPSLSSNYICYKKAAVCWNTFIIISAIPESTYKNRMPWHRQWLQARDSSILWLLLVLLTKETLFGNKIHKRLILAFVSVSWFNFCLKAFLLWLTRFCLPVNHSARLQTQRESPAFPRHSDGD